MPLPHINNVDAGHNRYDPMMGSVFQIDFTVPAALSTYVNEDYVRLLTQQVTDVSGLDALQKTVQAGSQKFLGVDVSFLNTSLDNTYADITVNLNLNLKDTTDAYVLRIFKLWSKLNYDLQSGARTLKMDYVAPTMTIYEANRNGFIWRKATFKDVLLTGVTGLETLDYTSNEARKLQCVFRSDYWDEEYASDWNGNAAADLEPSNVGEVPSDYPFDSEFFGRRP